MRRWNTGEKEFLQALHQRMGTSGLSWRDDCIIKQINPGQCLVYSIDSLNRAPSRNRANDTRSFGKWIASLIANDVIACGTAPRGLALDIGLASFLDEDDFNLFIDGVMEVCSAYHMEYEGGNLNRGTFVGGMAWGISTPGSVIRRSGARNGSVLLATAHIGFGWAVELLHHYGYREESLLDDMLQSEIAQFKDHPIIHLEAFREIWKLNVIECGMDLTDGIIEFGYEIYDRTGLGVIFSPSPIHRLVKTTASILKIDPACIMFEPGYDTPYSHGWCIPEGYIDQVCEILCRHQVPHTILGRVTDSVSGVFQKNGTRLKSLPRYWDDKLNTGSCFDQWKDNILARFG